ncbi:carboxypeptidase regulatory-like domain-containing protein [Algibacter miyuki]|uniref:Carboxypeptidase regulatory-like domain-containing protein n=1 Tax=Algibacter miyuki TaxID=1306933 RepID=A0ABV5GXF8_9FLAO|nr:carboxypeptidase regulatory-like domain-containing protein [Algibacter miyuki]MDN3666121.1 carboxypeptidase regulatory-like domain-containing protein [Algibacter miyuki]
MKNLLIFALLFAASSTFAQVKLEGVVKDSIGSPLELANVIAINQDTQKLDAFGITNPEGRYKLSVEKNANYKIQVSYIGMKSASADISTTDAAIIKDFTLVSDNTLDAVELVYEMPVVMKGDTIIYNADSFKSGTERKLGDVLNKLPGVEVNDDGEIEVEGVKVGKVMVEGKEFFDGDSKLATQNIPANAIDKVEVLKNFSEVGQLSGVTNNQDNIAINIKLKQGKKNFWFGNVTAGGGTSDNEGLYLIQPKLFYYSPEYSINVIGDLNNIGEIAFTRRDYFNFTGGFRSPSRSSGTNIDLGSNNLGFLTLQNNRAKNINTKFGAANFSYSPKETLDLSGFAILLSNRTDLQEISDVQFLNDASRDENKDSNTRQRSDMAMLKFSAKYKPNGNNQLDYDVMARTSKESQDQFVISSRVGDIGELESSTPFSINQNLNYYYTLNEKNIFALEVQHLFQDEDPFYNAILENDPFNNDNDLDDPNNPRDTYDDTANDLGFDRDQLTYDISQEKRVKSNQMDAKVDYWNILNQKSDINFTVGTIYSKQDFNSNIFQTLDDETDIETTPIINDGLDANAIAYTFSDVYLGAHYRLKSGIFTFTPGFSAHAYSSTNDQFNVSYTDNFFRILPDLNVQLQLKKSERINFDYSMQTNFTDVNQLARGLVLNNYGSVFSGDQDLQSALAHNLNLSYFSFNMFNYTNVSARLNYSKTIDRIRTRSELPTGSVIRISSPYNTDLADESASANGRFQKTMGKFRATVNGSLSYTKFNQEVNNEPFTNENYSQTYRTELRTNFREAPNFEIGYRYSIQDNDQGTQRTKFYTKAPSIEFDALILKSFTFKTDYSYNDFSDEEKTINSYEFWDASLAYKKDADSKWEYEIKATNLLNTRSQNQSSVGDISVSATEYYIQPRFLTFRIRYEL